MDLAFFVRQSGRCPPLGIGIAIKTPKGKKFEYVGCGRDVLAHLRWVQFCSSHILFFVFRYLAIGQLKSTFAVRNINGKFPPSFKNMTECK
ncbi:hypothetical protein A9196_20800 [Aeromonas dhakensis]|nr:hypothetical protein A9196_20800 [Aeromonas dhakensis]